MQHFDTVPQLCFLFFGIPFTTTDDLVSQTLLWLFISTLFHWNRRKL